MTEKNIKSRISDLAFNIGLPVGFFAAVAVPTLFFVSQEASIKHGISQCLAAKQVIVKQENLYLEAGRFAAVISKDKSSYKKLSVAQRDNSVSVTDYVLNRGINAHNVALQMQGRPHGGIITSSFYPAQVRQEAEMDSRERETANALRACTMKRRSGPKNSLNS